MTRNPAKADKKVKLIAFDKNNMSRMGEVRLKGHGQDKEHWRDTGVRLRGPIVNALQSVFSQHWIEEAVITRANMRRYSSTERRPRPASTWEPGTVLRISDRRSRRILVLS